MKNYRKRIADDILMRKLEGKGAVLIEGPKWCGKTTTAEQLAASILYMDDPEKKAQNITMSELNPKRLLKGATPRLIDEFRNRAFYMADDAADEPIRIRGFNRRSQHKRSV